MLIRPFRPGEELALRTLFHQKGFRVIERRMAVVRGVALANARMVKSLDGSPAKRSP